MQWNGEGKDDDDDSNGKMIIEMMMIVMEMIVMVMMIVMTIWRPGENKQCAKCQRQLKLWKLYIGLINWIYVFLCVFIVFGNKVQCFVFHVEIIRVLLLQVFYFKQAKYCWFFHWERFCCHPCLHLPIESKYVVHWMLKTNDVMKHSRAGLQSLIRCRKWRRGFNGKVWFWIFTNVGAIKSLRQVWLDVASGDGVLMEKF